MNHWSDKYIDIPYKLFGTDPKTGMDCFTLLCHIFEHELDIKYLTPQVIYEIVDDAWFQKLVDKHF